MARRRKPRAGRNDAPGKSTANVQGKDSTVQNTSGPVTEETETPTSDTSADRTGEAPDRSLDADEARSPDAPENETQTADAPGDEVRIVPSAEVSSPDADDVSTPNTVSAETVPDATPTSEADAPTPGETGAGQSDDITATETRSGWGASAAETPASSDATDGTVPESDAPSEPTEDTTHATATADASAESTAQADTAAPEVASAGRAAKDDSAGSATPDRPEPAPVVRTEQITVRKGGFWSMLLGGVAAAAIGLAASPYVWPYLQPYAAAYLPEDIVGALPEGEGPAARLDDQAQRLADLEARIDSLPAPPDPSAEIERLEAGLSGVRDDIATLQDRIESVETRPAPQEPASDGDTPDLTRLEDRIAALEDRLAPQPSDGGVTEEALAQTEDDLAAQMTEISETVSGLETELSADLDAAVSRLEERLAAQRDDIDALQSQRAAEEEVARDSARGTLRRAALTQVQTALDTGAPFAEALDELRETGAEVPDALASVAGDGVPTQAALEADFPDAARAALATVRAETDDLTGSVGDFLRSQLGIRSLEPREGDDADAILSRADAAVSEGRLDAALSEIAGLPEVAQSALSDWTARAEARRDALAAADAMSADLN